MNAMHELWHDHSQNGHGQLLREFCAKSQCEVLNKAQPTFAGVNEGWSTIDLGIATHRFYCKLKDLFADLDAEQFTGAPNRGHYSVWVVFELDVNNIEDA